MSMEDDSRPVLVPTVATRMQSTTVGWRGNRRGHHGGTPECCLIYPLIQYRVSVNVGHRLFGSAWHRLGQRDVMALEGGVNLVWNSRKIAAVCWVCTRIIGRDTFLYSSTLFGLVLTRLFLLVRTTPERRRQPLTCFSARSQPFGPTKPQTVGMRPVESRVSGHRAIVPCCPMSVNKHNKKVGPS